MSGQTPDELEILLDGQHYRLSSPLQFAGLKTFPGKTVIGDYSLDSNLLLSAWVISDLTGGHGIADLNEAVDAGRYRYGDIITRYPQQFTLPFQYKYGQFGTSTQAYCPVGNMYIPSSSHFKYFSTLGTDLRADETSLGATALAAVPGRRKGVNFQGTAAEEWLYIPLGNSGYATYTPSTNTVANHSGSGPYFRDFLLWDDKLIGLDRDGQLWKITAAGGTWVSYGQGGKLPGASGGRALAGYVNAAGDPTVHVLGEYGVWAFDAAGPKLWRLKIDLPPHPHVWSGFCTWRGDLYIGVGMDVIQWNGSVQRNIGLSRDNGIPYELQGRIVDLVPELNSLFAFVQAVDETGANTGYLSVHEYSSYGWRALPMPINGSHKAGTLMGIMNSDALGYRLVIGTNGFGTSPNTPNRVEYYLPQNFTAPRAALEAGVIPFGATGTAPFITTDNGNAYFETGRFDGNMPAYTKIANALEITFADGSVSNQPAEFWYRTEADTAYSLLGTVANSTAGRYVLPFGTLTNGIYPGLPFQYIELKVVLYGGASQYTTPILQNMVLSYLKITSQSLSWVANIDLMAPQNGRSPQAIIDDVNALTTRSTFFPMLHRNATKRVQVSQFDGAENLANDERGVLRVNIIEIPNSISASVT